MALRSLLTRTRYPVAAALRFPATVSGSRAAGTRLFSTAGRLQAEHEDWLKMNAIWHYKSNQTRLEKLERHLEHQRTIAKSMERKNKYLRVGIMYMLLPAYILRVALEAIVQDLREQGSSTPPITQESLTR